ncbi:hypothetical protein OG21DRAFT_1500121 [Imleria badia]|nr:hypothetical protein OG21DRAFT_1500121 [Imleria badia]
MHHPRPRAIMPSPSPLPSSSCRHAIVLAIVFTLSRPRSPSSSSSRRHALALTVVLTPSRHHPPCCARHRPHAALPLNSPRRPIKPGLRPGRAPGLNLAKPKPLKPSPALHIGPGPQDLHLLLSPENRAEALNVTLQVIQDVLEYSWIEVRNVTIDELNMRYWIKVAVRRLFWLEQNEEEQVLHIVGVDHDDNEQGIAEEASFMNIVNVDMNVEMSPS